MSAPALGSAIAAARKAMPAKRPHKFTRERLESWRFAPATPRGRSAHANRQLKTPDATLNSVDAQIFALGDIKRALFVVRPPPTVVPPTVAYPPAHAASTSKLTMDLVHPLAASAAAHPGHLPSPAQRYPTDELNAPLVGSSRRWAKARVQLSSAEAAELRAVKTAHPRLSRVQLAERFNCHPEVVARLQYEWSDPRSVAAYKDRARSRVQSRERQGDHYLDRRDEPSFGRQVTMAERQWRRSLW